MARSEHSPSMTDRWRAEDDDRDRHSHRPRHRDGDRDRDHIDRWPRSPPRRDIDSAYRGRDLLDNRHISTTSEAGGHLETRITIVPRHPSDSRDRSITSQQDEADPWTSVFLVHASNLQTGLSNVGVPRALHQPAVIGGYLTVGEAAQIVIIQIDARSLTEPSRHVNHPLLANTDRILEISHPRLTLTSLIFEDVS